MERPRYTNATKMMGPMAFMFSGVNEGIILEKSKAGSVTFYAKENLVCRSLGESHCPGFSLTRIICAADRLENRGISVIYLKPTELQRTFLPGKTFEPWLEQIHMLPGRLILSC